VHTLEASSAQDSGHRPSQHIYAQAHSDTNAGDCLSSEDADGGLYFPETLEREAA
jgi:hypothetical protein